MVNYQVTLSDLRKHKACYSGYNKVVRMLQCKEFTGEDNERESYIRFLHKSPISLIDIANNNGIDNAIWCLRAIPNCDRDARLFAVWCARQVEHLMEDQRSKNVLNVAESFANGEASQDELAAARATAWDAARATAWDAARATAWDAARATARDAARATAWDAARDAQKEIFISMCNGQAPWQVKLAKAA